MVSGAGTCQRSSNASSLVIGIVRTTTVKGVGGESGSGCGSLFLLGCTKAVAAEQTHHKTIVMPVGNIGCSSVCIRMPSVALAHRKTNKKTARDQ
jgi:hypothetical protein